MDAMREAYEAAYPAAKWAKVDGAYQAQFAGMWAVWQAAVASCAPAVVEQASNLHSAIMNLPCTRTMSQFATKSDLMLYKEGHRDARHAAAELALMTKPVEQVDALTDERAEFDSAFLSANGFHTKAELEQEWLKGLSGVMFRAGAVIAATRQAGPVQQEPFAYISHDAVRALEKLGKHMIVPKSFVLRAAPSGSTTTPIYLEPVAAPVQAAPEGWREFIENIATPHGEPLNSICAYRDNASRRAHMGILRGAAQKLLAAAPAPGDAK